MQTPLNVAVCEDNADDLNLLLSCIARSGIPATVAAFSSCDALMDEFRPGRYDLIFLDIYIDEVQRGIDAAAGIREMDDSVMLAFTTTSTAYALESYRLRAIGYLEKPVRPSYVRDMLFLTLSKRKSAPSIALLIGGVSREVPLANILYFEQQNHAILVHTLSGVLRVSQTVKMGNIEAALPDTFLRCHYSYIANLKHVKSIDRTLCVFTMQDGSTVYIRNQSLKNAAAAYEDYLFLKARGNQE